MRRLSRRQRDRGAAALIIVILFSSTVLIGCAALTVDLGQINTERRQLQNGADASALSMAQTCGVKYSNSANCSYAAANAGSLGAAAVSTLNDNNAGPFSTTRGFNDGQSQFNTALTTTAGAPYDNGFCGHATALPECRVPAAPGLTDCLPLPSFLAANSNIPWIESHTLTKPGDSSSTSTLPSVFAKVWGSAGVTVGACSRVAIANGGGGDGQIPLTFSGCEWSANTGGVNGQGGSYYASPVGASPGYGGAGQPPWPAAATTPPTPGQEIIIYYQSPQANMTSCTNFNSHDVPGGFGELETVPGNSCQAQMYPFNWLHVQNGNNIGCNLDALVGHIVYLPVFDCIQPNQPNWEPDFSAIPPPVCYNGNGNNTYYHLAGYAQFYLSGYNINVTTGLPNKRKSLVSGSFPCNNPQQCVSGWFVSGQLQATIPGGPPAFGSWALFPAG